MNTIEKGTILENDYGRVKVLAFLDGCYLVSAFDNFDIGGNWYTSENLIELFTPVQEYREWPREGDIYYYISTTGGIFMSSWRQNKDFDGPIENYTGIYRLPKEAEEVRDKIREFVKGL